MVLEHSPWASERDHLKEKRVGIRNWCNIGSILAQPSDSPSSPWSFTPVLILPAVGLEWTNPILLPKTKEYITLIMANSDISCLHSDAQFPRVSFIGWSYPPIFHLDPLGYRQYAKISLRIIYRHRRREASRFDNSKELWIWKRRKGVI